jgi:hypothetical protein
MNTTNNHLFHLDVEKNGMDARCSWCFMRRDLESGGGYAGVSGVAGGRGARYARLQCVFAIVGVSG